MSTIAWWFYSNQAKAPLKPFFWLSFIVKMLASTALGIIYAYLYHYNSDSFAYFNDAVALSKIALQEPAGYFRILLFNEFSSEQVLQTLELWSQPRAFFMAKLLSIITLLTFNNYWVSGWYLSLFSFWGMWKLANTLVTLFPATRIAAAIAFLWFPSVVFWSSGVMKESIVMGCAAGSVSLLLISIFRLKNDSLSSHKILSAVFITLSCLVLWQLKYYYLGALLPVCIAYIIALFVCNRFYTGTSPMFAACIFLLFFTGILLVATRIHPNLHVDRFLIMLVDNHRLIYGISDKDNVIQFNNLQPSLHSLLANFPLALVSGLFRPFIWEARSAFQLAMGLENLALLLLSVYALRPKNFSKLSGQPQYQLLLLATVLYIVFLAVLMAFASPNFGTLARYKIGFLPFFIYLLLFNLFPDSLSFRQKRFTG